MLSTILSAFTVAEIRKKLLFTAAILALYRLGSFIPVPGVDTDAVDAIKNNYSGSGVLNFLNVFSGGGLSRIALFALGIMPYITASIILQLLTVVVPSLEKLQKEGEAGQARITQYTRYLTVGLAFAQSEKRASRSSRFTCCVCVRNGSNGIDIFLFGPRSLRIRMWIGFWPPSKRARSLAPAREP